MPLDYGVLPEKTEALYTDLFSALDSFGQYDPQSFPCDYEHALHNPIVNTWPSVTLRDCFFHYCQALWRKLQQSDLVPEYEVDNSPVRTYFKMMCALPFVQRKPYQLPGDISSPSSQVKCSPLSTTTNIPGLDPLTTIIPLYKNKEES